MKTVTIGIPAFNEQANIKDLLENLLSQNKGNFNLENIIISSDGSTDKTIEQIKKVNDKKILVIDNKNRQGRAVRQNQIIKKSNSDILVLLDADILIKDNNFLNKLTKPIINQKADLTSVSVEELDSKNFLEKVLTTSMKFKKSIFENYKQGNNLLTCHGRARAFSKRLYKKINFKNSVGEDAYSYFYAVDKGFKYRFVKGTQVFYRLPQNFKDHEKQSIRFYQTLKLMEKEFGKELVNSENFISSGLLLKSLVRFIFIDPLILVYFFIALFLKIKSLIVKDVNDLWTISQSSKNLKI